MPGITRRAFALSCTSLAYAQTPADGWISLFDGVSTRGWLEITGKPFPSNCWTIEDGCLKALPRLDGFQDIRTVETFRSFDLRFEWKLLDKGNSGVKYKIQKTDEFVNAQGRQARARGLEYQLAADDDPDAASDPRRVAGSLYSVIAPSPKVSPRIGAFNDSSIVVEGTKVQHWLNGQRIVSFATTDEQVVAQLRGNMAADDKGPVHEEGPISLQNHSSETWFRNLRIRRL